MDQNKKTPMYKRVLALAGVILLVGMYIYLLVMALTGSPDTYNIFISCVAATIAIPILLWLIIWAVGAFAGRHTVASLDAMSSNKAHDRYGNVIPDGEIDTVVFDIGNVLTDFAWKEFLLDKGFDEEMAERIGNASVRTKDWNEIDIGNLSTEEIIGRFIKNDPEIEDELKRAFSDFNDIVRKRDRAIPWIEALKAAGYRVLYLSNFSEQALLGCPDAMSFIEHTDGGILSFRDHVIKPYPEIYRLLTERFDIVPAKTVFIDDTKPNVDTAVSLGWKGVVYKDYEQVKRDLEALKVRY